MNNTNQPTKVDSSWRDSTQTEDNQTPQMQTQVDTSWRNKQNTDNANNIATPTSVDTSWRDINDSSASTPVSSSTPPSTQVDISWREQQNANGVSQPTQVDNSWRNNNGQGGETQVDYSWRENINNSNNMSSQNISQATQADPSWRDANQQQSPSTQVDQSWRNNSSPSTQVDEGWRIAAEGMLDPSNVMNKATANYFLTIDDFKESVSQLTELKTVNNNIYPVKKTLSKSGGESVILLCSDIYGNDVVAKIYYEPVNGAGSSISARTRVIQYMGTEEGKKYTLPVQEIGLIEFGNSKYYFEIMPFCEKGDLSIEEPMSFEALVEVTAFLNEALHSIHDAGILHRDIKPQNIYKTDNGIVLGDFGTAKIAENGTSEQTSTVVGTDGYTAPELRLGLTQSPTFYYTTKIDYYSMGVTLGSLFEGHFVYKDMTPGMITTAVQKGRLPLTRLDPHREELENLLRGLCRFDANYRFGYEEVNKWLQDHNYTGGGVEEEWLRPFIMLGEKYQDEKSMFFGMTKDAQHWEEAKGMLFSRLIDPFFSSFRPDLARKAQIVDDLYRASNRDKGLATFLKDLYPPGPIVWKGYTFNSLADLANKMVKTKTPTAYAELLQNNIVSHWLSNTEGISVDENTQKMVSAIEEYSLNEPEIACYWFGFTFANQDKYLSICQSNVSSIPELLQALFSSPNRFYQTDGYDKLIDKKTGADLYGFLFSFGLKDVITPVWDNLSNCNLFNQVVLLFSMLDNIAVMTNANPDIIRMFFINYGPVGIYVYIQNIINNSGKNPIYVPNNADGKQILSQISKFRVQNNGNIDELYRSYIPLIQFVDTFKNTVMDNPYDVSTGSYGNCSIICNNLMGCFAFNIFDVSAPLGFCALLESR